MSSFSWTVHEFYRLKALITRERVNTLMVGKKIVNQQS